MSTPPPPPPGPPSAIAEPADVTEPGAALPSGVAAMDAASQAKFRQIRRLSHILDNQFQIPGTDRRFGVDAIIGMIPGIGGVAGLVLAAIVIAQGIAIGARGATVVRMVLNAGADAAMSSIPFVGWISDLFFKANERNVRLMSTFALEPDRTQAESKAMLITTLIVVVATAVILVSLAAAAIVGLLVWIF